MKILVRRVTLVAMSLLSLAACNTTTVLHSTFNTESAGGTPLRDQPVGTVLFREGAGSVTIEPAPGDTTGWARVRHEASAADRTRTELRARFDASHGTGKYTLLAVLYIPSGAGPVTLWVETLGDLSDISSSADFLRLEFMPDGRASFDAVGDPLRQFGAFQHDREFLVSVAIDSTGVLPTATLSLRGAGAAGGSFTPLSPRARDFGAVRLLIDGESRGSVYVDDILVTRQNM